MPLVKPKSSRPTQKKEPMPGGDCAALAFAIEDEDAGVRRQAARRIIHCPDAAARLVSRLRREDDIAVREVMFTALMRLNDPTALGGLVSCLRSEDAALRNEAIETFKQMGSKAAVILESLLADPDPDVRVFAVNILACSQNPDLEEWLIKVIEQDSQVNVCATAVDLLCEVATEAAIEPLVRLKARFQTEAYIRFAADLALKRIREI